MPIPMSVRLSSTVLSAARRRAAENCRSLESYVEMLIRCDLNMAPRLEVIAPDDIGEYKAVPWPGETRAERRSRDALFHAIRKSGTRPARKR